MRWLSSSDRKLIPWFFSPLIKPAALHKGSKSRPINGFSSWIKNDEIVGFFFLSSPFYREFQMHLSG